MLGDGNSLSWRRSTVNEANLPFFRPLWRRIAVVAVCVVWTVVEWVTNDPLWAIVGLGFTAYAVWQFLYLYKPVDEDKVSADPKPRD
jgi:hypothetical protein